jgi:hypothetical protein
MNRAGPAAPTALADIARLCRVQRPVVSVWRRRARASSAPFSQPVAVVGGEERFDVEAVVDWLERTGRGNNPSVRADAAVFARHHGISPTTTTRRSSSPPLLCLKVVTGESLAGQSPDDLLGLADKQPAAIKLVMEQMETTAPRYAAQRA